MIQPCSFGIMAKLKVLYNIYLLLLLSKNLTWVFVSVKIHGVIITHTRSSMSVGHYVEAGGAQDMISNDFNSPVSIIDHWKLSNLSTIIGS